MITSLDNNNSNSNNINSQQLRRMACRLMTKLVLDSLDQHISEGLEPISLTKARMKIIGTRIAKRVSLIHSKIAKIEMNLYLKIEQSIKVNGKDK